MNLALDLLAAVALLQQAQPLPSSKPMEAEIRQTTLAPLSLTDVAGAGIVEVFTSNKELAVLWSYDSSEGRQFYREPFDLAYWPTAAARISDQRLTRGTNMVVGGKRPGLGNTLIERWNLQFADVPSLATPTTVTKTVLFEANVAGKRGIRFMTPVNGVPDRVFVQFEDSSAFYSLDTTNGQLTLMATATEVPSLTNKSLKLMSSGKAGTTYTYVYQCDFSLTDGGAVVMSDIDGNGLIDAWTELYDLAAWTSFVQSNPFSASYSD